MIKISSYFGNILGSIIFTTDLNKHKSISIWPLLRSDISQLININDLRLTTEYQVVFCVFDRRLISVNSKIDKVYFRDFESISLLLSFWSYEIRETVVTDKFCMHFADVLVAFPADVWCKRFSFWATVAVAALLPKSWYVLTIELKIHSFLSFCTVRWKFEKLKIRFDHMPQKAIVLNQFQIKKKLLWVVFSKKYVTTVRYVCLFCVKWL